MIRKAVTAGLLAGTLGLAGAGVGVSAALSSGKTHTLTFTSIQTFGRDFKHHAFADTDKDLQNGKVVGMDAVTGRVMAAKKRATGFASFAMPGGMLHTTFTIQFADGSLSGKITGGAGKYAGANGTLTGVPIDKTGNNYRITMKYQQ